MFLYKLNMALDFCLLVMGKTKRKIPNEQTSKDWPWVKKSTKETGDNGRESITIFQRDYIKSH